MAFTGGGSIRSLGGEQVEARAVAPDYIIKFEPVNEPAPAGGLEEFVNGDDGAVIQEVRSLVESGRTTPSRVQVYANLRPVIDVAVQFAPQPPKAR